MSLTTCQTQLERLSNLDPVLIFLRSSPHVHAKYVNTYQQIFIIIIFLGIGRHVDEIRLELPIHPVHHDSIMFVVYRSRSVKRVRILSSQLVRDLFIGQTDSCIL